jgi:hypothetical protein
MASAERRRRRLVVVPSDPISTYEEKGRGSVLRDYYNPRGWFEEVVALSPLEQGERHAHGLRIVGTSERDFPRRLAEIRPDLVRAYGGYWAADLCCRERLGGVPVVVSVHDSNPKRPRRSRMPIWPHMNRNWPSGGIEAARSSARSFARASSKKATLRFWWRARHPR